MNQKTNDVMDPPSLAQRTLSAVLQGHLRVPREASRGRPDKRHGISPA